MKSLREIRSITTELRDLLETQFGITSAEALFEHVVRNSAGIRRALKLSPAELEQLQTLVEGHLSPAFVARCRQPLKKHARGVIVDGSP